MSLPRGRFLIHLVMACCLAGHAYAQSRPNVLLIVADDMGFGDIGAGGNEIIHTPNLDSLSRISYRFNNFYVSPVCAPTRASLLTGKYHQRTGVWSVTNGFETMRPEVTTMAEIFSDAGYLTGLFGKWHLGENFPSVPQAQGFQRYVGFRTGHAEQYFDPVLEDNGKPHPAKGYITDILADEAIKFMKEAAGKPFLCYVPFNAPHTPLDVPGDYLVRYQGRNLNERVMRIYAMMENLDHNVGRLWQTLDDLKLSDNTIIIYMSDNGPIDVPSDPSTWRYNAGLRDQKFSIYEGGIRSRFFLYRPHAMPVSIATTAAHIDVLPTLLDLCGLEQPGIQFDGHSLVPLLNNERDSLLENRMLYLNYSLRTLNDRTPYPGGIVRWHQYKMVNGEELYDLSSDEGEQHNLAEQAPAVLDRLDSAYLAWWQHDIAGNEPLPPVSVGYVEEPVVTLPPHVGRVQGNLQYFGWRGLHSGVRRMGRHPSGVDSDWVTHWKATADVLSWNIQVVTGREYEFAATVGGSFSEKVKLAITCDDNTLQWSAGKAVLPDDGWMERPCGTMVLAPGLYTVTVHPLSISAADSLALKKITVSIH